MNLFYKLLVLIIAFLNHAQSTPLDLDGHRTEADLLTYYDSIIHKTNFEVDPCNDFEKYACGNVEENSEVISVHQMATLINPVFGNNEPQNEAERKVRDMHLSCINIFNRTKGDYLKIVKELLKQVDDIRFITNENDVTDEGIAKMFIKLMLLGYNGEPLDFDVTLDQLKIDSVFYFENNDNLETILKAADHLEIKDKIIELMEKFKNFKYEELERDSETLIPIEKLQETIQSKNINLAGCYNAFKNEFNLNNTKVMVMNVQALKEVTKIFDSTDKATVYNYLTYKYIFILSNVNCNEFNLYYRYAILSRFWRDNFEDEVTTNRFLNFLDSFETFLKKINEVKPRRYVQIILEKLNSKRNVAKNYKTILSDELRDEFYEKFDIDVNKYFVNTIKTFSYINHIISNISNDEETQNSTSFGLFFGRFDDTIKFTIRNKPSTYLYNALGYELWRKIFKYNGKVIESEYQAAKKCLNENQEQVEEYYNLDSFFPFKFQRLTFLVMENDMANPSTELYKEKELIKTENHFKKVNDIKQLVFIAGAQHQCEINKNRFKEFVHNTLKYSIEFSETFNCHAGSPMNFNQGCEVKKCTNDETQYRICNGKVFF